MRFKIKYPATAVFLGMLLGCATAKHPGTPPPPPPAVLETAIQMAVKNTLEMRVLESLQKIAREHVEKSRLLELPGMISDFPRRLPELNVENDFRLPTLDHAIESCHILTSPAKDDLHKLQSESEKQKIAVEQACLWAKLDYASRLRKAGLKTFSLKSLQRDTTLELAISSGISEDVISRFDYSSLPQPHPLKKSPEPVYIRQMLQSYKSSPDSALRFADIIYRLPSELLHRKDSNFHAAFELVQAAGRIIQQRLLHAYADNSLKQFQNAEKKLKQARFKTPMLYSELELHRLQWRIAFFKLKYHPLLLPAKPDPREVAFLTDLISLQDK